MRFTHTLLARRTCAMLLVCLLLLGAASPALAQRRGVDDATSVQTEEEAEASNDFSTPERLLQYLARHRRDVALVSYSLNPDGTVDTSDPVINVNGDEPMPLASTMKIVLLAAYAREAARGRLDPNLRITLADWERNYLPGTDGDAHVRALAALGLPADEYGFAQDPQARVSLEQMVRAMIEFSDNAAADWLIERLGAAVGGTIADAGMRGQEPILSPLGIFLSWNNHEQGALSERRLSQLRRMSDEEYASEVRRLHDAFQQPAWRLAEFQWRLQDGPSRDRRLAGLAGEAFLPRGTARDYARMMGRVLTGTFISPEVCETMRRHLEWPMQSPAVSELFTAFGNKGGSFDGGVLTDADFYRPRAGDFADKPRVSVLFMHRLPSAVFDLLTHQGPSEAMQQVFDAKTAYERAFAETVLRTLTRQRAER